MVAGGEARTEDAKHVVNHMCFIFLMFFKLARGLTQVGLTVGSFQIDVLDHICQTNPELGSVEANVSHILSKIQHNVY